MNRTNGKLRAVRAFTVLAALSAAAQAPRAGANSSLEDAIHAMFGVHDFLQVEISPDGQRVAWVESLPGPDAAPSPESAIYVAELSAPASSRRITAGLGKAPHQEHDLAWSPDSKRLAFLPDAASQGQLQLFVSDACGGAATQLTHLRGFLSPVPAGLRRQDDRVPFHRECHARCRSAGCRDTG